MMDQLLRISCSSSNELIHFATKKIQNELQKGRRFISGGLVLQIEQKTNLWRFKILNPTNTKETEAESVNKLLAKKKEEYTIMEFHGNAVIVSTQTNKFCSVFEVKAEKVRVLMFYKITEQKAKLIISADVLKMGMTQVASAVKS